MKKILTTAAVLACLSTTAFGFGNTYNNDDSINNTANGGNGYAGAIAGSYAGGGDAEQGQGQVGINKSKNTNKSKSGVEDSGNSVASIYDGGDTYHAAKIPKRPVSTAYSSLVLSNWDCSLGASAGVQTGYFGITGGAARESDACKIIKLTMLNAEINRDMDNLSALLNAIQCQEGMMREAFKVTGDYNAFCVGAKVKTKSKWLGFGSVKAYQEACPYPNSTGCKRKR